MKYTIASRETFYAGIMFRSRLEAKWAAFFDLLGWPWEYEPVDFQSWVPDFWFGFPCSHSECAGTHTVYAEVKPYRRVEEFKGHPAYGIECGRVIHSDPDSREGFWEECLGVDAVALLGLHPRHGVSVIQSMGHGAGAGDFDIGFFVDDSDVECLWREASNMTRWKRSVGGVYQ